MDLETVKDRYRKEQIEGEEAFDLIVAGGLADPIPSMVADFLDEVCQNSIRGGRRYHMREWKTSQPPFPTDMYSTFRRAYLEVQSVTYGAVDRETLMRLAESGHTVSAVALIHIEIDRSRMWSWPDSPPSPEERLLGIARMLDERGRGEGPYFLSLHRRDPDQEILLLKRATDFGYWYAPRALYDKYTKRKGSRALTDEEELDRVIRFHEWNRKHTRGDPLDRAGSDSVVRFLSRYQELEAQVRRLQDENETLKTELSYRPGGDGYHSAEEDFNQKAGTPGTVPTVE